MKGVCTFKFINKIFSNWQCGFCQGYSAQRCLLVMVEKWKQYPDKGGVSVALLIDLSKAFNCLLHELLIAKLAAYGLYYNSLQKLQSYLLKQKTKNKTL